MSEERQIPSEEEVTESGLDGHPAPNPYWLPPPQLYFGPSPGLPPRATSRPLPLIPCIIIPLPGYGPPPPPPPFTDRQASQPQRIQPPITQPFCQALPIDNRNTAQNNYNFAKRRRRSIQRRLKHYCWRACKIISVMAILLAAVTLAVTSMYRWHTMFNPEDMAQSVAPTNANALVSRIVDTNSGLRYLEGIKSINLRGEMSIGARSYDFVEFRKHPQQSWLKQVGENELSIYALDTQGAWKKTKDASGHETLEMLSTDTFQSMRADYSLLNPLFDYALSGRSDAQLVHGEQDEFTIKINHLNGNKEVLIGIDANALQINWLTILRQDSVPIHREYSDYQFVDGVWIPFTIEHHSSGQPDKRMTVNKAVINPGVMSSFFKMPQLAESES